MQSEGRIVMLLVLRGSWDDPRASRFPQPTTGRPHGRDRPRSPSERTTEIPCSEAGGPYGLGCRGKAVPEKEKGDDRPDRPLGRRSPGHRPDRARADQGHRRGKGGAPSPAQRALSHLGQRENPSPAGPARYPRDAVEGPGGVHPAPDVPGDGQGADAFRAERQAQYEDGDRAARVRREGSRRRRSPIISPRSSRTVACSRREAGTR